MGLGLKRFWRNTVSACVMVAAVGFAPQAQANPLSAELVYLLENYPAIRAKASLSDAAREDIKAAYGLTAPVIALSGDTGYQRTDNPGKNDMRVQGNLTATYNLFDGHYSVFETKSAQVAHQSTLADLDTTKQLILFQGIQAYLNLVLQNKMVEISQTNVKLVEQIKTFIESESNVGRMSQADLLQARARLAQAREALTAYQGSQRQGQNRYFHLFQRVPPAGRMQDPLAPQEVVPESLEEAIRVARKHNPMLKSASLLAEAASSRVGSVESALYPRVDLEASADAKYNVDGTDGAENEGSVLLKMNWNLFDGDRTRSQSRAAALRHNAAMMDLRHKHLEVEEQVRNAFSIIQTERRRYRTLQEAETIAAEAFNARHEMMESGKETIITVLDTALELLNVRIAVTSSDYAHRLANYQLLLATGQLNQDSIGKLVIESTLQPAVADDNKLIKKLLEGDALKKTPSPQLSAQDALERGVGMNQPTQLAPTTNYDEMAPMQLETASTTGRKEGYNDMAAFESAHGAPYSDELAPESAPTGPIELGPAAGDESGFYVVLGSFAETAYAQDRITMVGMNNAFIKSIDVNGNTYQRVMVGPMSASEAESARATASDRGVPDSWIIRQ
ncbi:TolC family protein [Terasakiella sp. SH-1]|uniref:TolC family protein n=1 Tax=Terasakiella sp. SH-1 TaxID=2560057 RepID=UPI0010739982|nr:TolC family protein [Terasakiella sp. SH-1]